MDDKISFFLKLSNITHLCILHIIYLFISELLCILASVNSLMKLVYKSL